jgi:DNA-entry nuclease
MKKVLIIFLMVISLLTVSCSFEEQVTPAEEEQTNETTQPAIVEEEEPAISDVPDDSDENITNEELTWDSESANVFPTNKQKYNSKNRESIEINNNSSGFSEESINAYASNSDTNGYFELSSLDEIGRAGTASALLNDNLIPTEDRKSLRYNPTGWQNERVNISGSNLYFYNRTHLLGFQLTGLNDEPRNLITGTVKMNNPVMLNYENQLRNYLDNTDNAIFYQVIPYYKNEELVARSVLLRAKSIDLKSSDDEEIEFNVLLYNRNPGWKIDYSTGSFKFTAAKTETKKKQPKKTQSKKTEQGTVYITKSGKKYHAKGCRYLTDSASKIKKKTAVAEGFEPCKVCGGG